MQTDVSDGVRTAGVQRTAVTPAAGLLSCRKNVEVAQELPSVAVMVAVAWPGTIEPVVAVKVVLTLPAGIAAVAGTVTTAVEDARPKEVPLAGAGLEIVMVHEVELFDGTDTGVHCNDEMLAVVVEVEEGFKLTTEFCEMPLKEAVSVAVCASENTPAFTVKLAVAAPAATETLAGTLNIVEEELIATEIAAVAVLLRVTEQVADKVGRSVAGVHDRAVRRGVFDEAG